MTNQRAFDDAGDFAAGNRCALVLTVAAGLGGEFTGNRFRNLADETAAIRSRVEAMAGAQVELAQEVDPDLLGGLTIQVRDQLLDASIRGRLERLRDQLHAGTRPR